MSHDLGSLGGAALDCCDDDMDEVEEVVDGRIRKAGASPRIRPCCSVIGCTERPLRQFSAGSSRQIMFMCKTHFQTVPIETQEGWKQYRGTRTFPETRIAAACRPGPNRGSGVAAPPVCEVEPESSIMNSTRRDDGKMGKGPTKNALWPGKVYNVIYQLWNAHAEKKKAETGDSYMTSLDRAGLVPAAARILREQGLADMATKLENTTTGARKAIHSRVMVKYLKNREAFLAKLRRVGLGPQEVADWEAALDSAQHYVDLMPVRERDSLNHQRHESRPYSHSHPQSVSPAASAMGGGSASVGIGGGVGLGAASGRPFSSDNGLLVSRKKVRRKAKVQEVSSSEAKRARALDAIVSAAEQSNVLQKGAADAGARHLRRLELADAERLNMETEEHALRMAIGKSALALLNKMAGEPPPEQGASAA